MAGSSFLLLIDDIAALLDDIALMTDDVAVMSKVAVKKTASVLGDDLALNAQQVSGVKADRELPVVWAVAKGSFINKVILVPAALAISAFIPWAVIPLLMIGGAFLCYEGFEKLAHKFLHHSAEDQAHHDEHLRAVANHNVDLVAFEREKIKGAVRTDFILSAEIIVIALGTVASAPFEKQVAVLTTIAVLMTVGVYGLVAGIVKLDDGGLTLSRKTGVSWWAALQRRIGKIILQAAPYLMSTLSIAGTAAMFLVGGGIVVHGIPVLHHFVEHASVSAKGFAVGGAVWEVLTYMLLNGVAGIVFGALVLLAVTSSQRVMRLFKPA